MWPDRPAIVFFFCLFVILFLFSFLVVFGRFFLRSVDRFDHGSIHSIDQNRETSQTISFVFVFGFCCFFCFNSTALSILFSLCFFFFFCQVFVLFCFCFFFDIVWYDGRSARHSLTHLLTSLIQLDYFFATITTGRRVVVKESGAATVHCCCPGMSRKTKQLVRQDLRIRRWFVFCPSWPFLVVREANALAGVFLGEKKKIRRNKSQTHGNQPINKTWCFLLLLFFFGIPAQTNKQTIHGGNRTTIDWLIDCSFSSVSPVQSELRFFPPFVVSRFFFFFYLCVLAVSPCLQSYNITRSILLFIYPSRVQQQ